MPCSNRIWFRRFRWLRLWASARTECDSAALWRFDVNSSTPPGKRWVVALGVTDKGGWVSTIYDATYAANRGLSGVATADLSALAFEVVGPSSIPSYKAIEGDTSSVTQGSSEGLTFCFDAPADRLCSVEVDGKQVSPECYTVRLGSTILTLTPTYLDTLATGEHVVTVFYADGGRASATFKTSQKAVDEKTGATPEVDKKSAIDNKEIGNDVDNSNRNSGGKSAALAETGDYSQTPAAIAIGVATGALAIAVCSRKRSSSR